MASSTGRAILNSRASVPAAIASRVRRIWGLHQELERESSKSWNCPSMKKSAVYFIAPVLMSCIPPRVVLSVSADVGPRVTAQCLFGNADSKRSDAPKCLLVHGGSTITYSFSAETHELFASSQWKFPSRQYPVLTPACSAELQGQIASQLSTIRSGCSVAAASPPWKTRCEIRTYQGPYSRENRSHGEICPDPKEIR
jgi:hypothetical protein